MNSPFECGYLRIRVSKVVACLALSDGGKYSHVWTLAEWDTLYFTVLFFHTVTSSFISIYIVLQNHLDMVNSSSPSFIVLLCIVS